MQDAATLEGWESTDMDDFQEASSEVDGIPPGLRLLADPGVPIQVPETQVKEHGYCKRPKWSLCRLDLIPAFFGHACC